MLCAGVIPSSLGYLLALVKLNLSSNKLSGIIVLQILACLAKRCFLLMSIISLGADQRRSLMGTSETLTFHLLALRKT